MYVPRWYQDEAVNSIFSYYAEGKTGHPVVAMPTATGKSLVIAEFIKRTLQLWPSQRFIMGTHVKELINQNAEKIRAQWPNVPLGIFSAGLGEKNIAPVVYGGIASMVNAIERFGRRDLLLVDEAHLISPKQDSMYQKLIKGLTKANANLKVIGFTATPYRMGQGLLTDGGLFTDICYDLCNFKNFNRLINEGYLVPPIPKRTQTELDVTGVKLTAGDFNQEQLAIAVDKDKVTYEACKEIADLGYDRKSWLIFASSIKHAEHVAHFLQSFGIDVVPVHSKLEDDECDKRIAAFRNFKHRGIVNFGKLTTGFDHPAIDLIGMLRPTMSTSLWVQMLGRGTRPSPATLKENCLVLDFARNTIRLGPINDPVIPRKRIKGDEPGVAPVRICPQCGVYNHARATHCIACGFEFPKVEKLINTAGTEELLRREVEPIVGHFTVQNVVYNRHQKPGSPPILKVSYFCGLQLFNEYICLEHGGLAAKKARDWWRTRMGTLVAPPTIDEALKYTAQLKVPKTIRVWTNKKYPEVLGFDL
jgi:DNA repair protein RadD